MCRLHGLRVDGLRRPGIDASRVWYNHGMVDAPTGFTVTLSVHVGDDLADNMDEAALVGLQMIYGGSVADCEVIDHKAAEVNRLAGIANPEVKRPAPVRLFKT
jgi:hypothetical protein